MKSTDPVTDERMETDNAKPKLSNESIYLLGLLLLGLGLALGVSVATALTVVGAILTAVSVVTSFFVTWLSGRP